MSNSSKIPISGLLRGEGHTKPAPTPLSSPEPVAPINNQQFPPYPRKLTITWKPVTGATDYTLTVGFLCTNAQGKNWLSKPPINTTTTSLTVDFPANVPGRWSVKANDSTGTHTSSADSAWSSFDFTVQPLDIPIQTSPQEGQIFNHYPRATTLAWNPVPSATGYVVTVEACQDREILSGSVWQTVQKTIVNTNAFTFNFNGAQPGRWNVFAIDSTNSHQQSAPSAWRTFKFTI